jgi:hypothetical protein
MAFSYVQRYGNPSNGLPQPEWTVHDNGYGLLEGSLKMFYNHTDSIPNGIPKKGTPHPHDSRLHAYDISTTIGKNYVAYVEAKYIGIAHGNTTDAEWSISGTTSDENIRFNPNFPKFCAEAVPPYTEGENYEQTTQAKTTGVILDADGLFQKFAPKHKTVPAVEQFVSPACTCEITFYTKDITIATWAVSGRLGSWCNTIPYAPSFMTANGTVNWLITSASTTPYGDIYKCSWTFTLSTLGKPHNKFMYSEFTTPKK